MVDLEDAAAGDPYADLGALLAALRADVPELCAGAAGERLAAAYLDGYRERAGTPLDERRLRAHRERGGPRRPRGPPAARPRHDGGDRNRGRAARPRNAARASVAERALGGVHERVDALGPVLLERAERPLGPAQQRGQRYQFRPSGRSAS